jgi:hypothetical protein
MNGVNDLLMKKKKLKIKLEDLIKKLKKSKK